MTHRVLDVHTYEELRIAKATNLPLSLPFNNPLAVDQLFPGICLKFAPATRTNMADPDGPAVNNAEWTCARHLDCAVCRGVQVTESLPAVAIDPATAY